MIDDFVQPRRVFSYDVSEECEGSSLLQLIRLLKTLLEFVEDVNIVGCLNFDKDLENPKRVCVCIVIDHAINNPAFLSCKKREDFFSENGIDDDNQKMAEFYFGENFS